MDRLSEIRARCEAFEDSSDSYKGVRPQYILPVLADDGYSRNWAEIAAHSHDDIPYLLEEIERLQAENKRLDIEDAKDALRGDTLRGELQKMTARAEKAEAERNTYREALQNWNETPEGERVMGRLTKHTPDNFGYAEYQLKHGVDEQSAISRLAAFEDTGMEPEEIKDFVSRRKEATELAGLCKEAGIDRLRELAEADKDGRCVVLPCPFYSEVYALAQAGNEIIHGELRSTNKDYCLIVNLEGNLTSKGKTWHGVQVRKEDVYLTREAAEAALKAGDHR